MDNAQKAIIIGVGLFITIIIISVVLLITNLGTGTIGDATDNVTNMSKALQNNLRRLYDNKQITGADVKNLYIQYKDSDEVWLVIQVEHAPNRKGLRATICGFNKIMYNEMYFDRKNYCKYATIEKQTMIDLGSDKSEPYNIRPQEKYMVNSEKIPNISSTAKYISQLILDKNKEVVGILCKLI